MTSKANAIRASHEIIISAQHSDIKFTFGMGCRSLTSRIKTNLQCRGWGKILEMKRAFIKSEIFHMRVKWHEALWAGKSNLYSKLLDAKYSHWRVSRRYSIICRLPTWISGDRWKSAQLLRHKFTDDAYSIQIAWTGAAAKSIAAQMYYSW